MLRSSVNWIVLKVERIAVVMSLIAIMKKVPERGEPCEPVEQK